MATEKRKMHRVIDAAGNLVQVLLETSAEQVTVADAGNKLTATNVEDALQELAEAIGNAGKVNDVLDANGSSIVTNKIAKLSKAAVGLGNVDNTADADKNVKHATSADSATTANSANTANSATKATQDASGNVITSTYATKNELRDGLAGRANTKTYENYQAFVTAVNAMNNTALKVGDNVYIKKLDVPDMWVTAVNATSAPYTYTNDQAIINALDTTDGLTVGYFSFSKLETEKVALSTYQTKTDNSLATADKTVVGAINEVKNTADSALSKANANDTEIANIKNGTNGTKVKKAETADNATNVTTNINGKKISSIFEDDGITVKNATHAMSADSSTKVINPLYFAGHTDDGTLINLAFNGSADKMLKFKQADFNCTTDNVSLMTCELSTVYTNTEKTQTVAGQYSAVQVDEKGRVTAGGKSIEWGTSGQTTPSGVLMLGGLFMELQE